MAFTDDLAHRASAVYADFFVPLLGSDARVLDCGCGSGSIAVGLGNAVCRGSVVGIDLGAEMLRPAVSHVGVESIGNVRFLAADGTALPFAADTFDGVLCHSVLEAAADPPAVLREIRRVLRPGGTVGVASVEYGGLILSGPESERLHRFYVVRERLWQLEQVARPRAGRDLRRLLADAGFSGVRAFAHYLSYGTPEEVRTFGEGRARDCVDPWYSGRAIAHGLLTAKDLQRTKSAWEEWSRSPAAFAAFAWCRATARKPADG